jgi:hypothetical protein
MLATIWSRVSDLIRFRDGSDSECASNFVQISKKKNATETLAMIRQAFRKESVSRTRVLNGKLGSGQTEKGETGEQQSHKQSHNFL